MAVIRVNKTDNYTVMSNTHFREKDMSLKAKGLLSLMLSLPDGWDYSIAGLVAMCKENESAIKSTLDELKQFGYLAVAKKLPNETASGRIEYEYTIYERPHGKQEVEKQGVENLGVEFLGVENQGVENQGQLNTNISNTKELNTKEEKRKKEKRAASSSFGKLLDDYADGDAELRELLGDWLKVRKAKRAALTDKAIQLNLDKLEQCAKDSGLAVYEYLREVIARGWAAFFVINTYSRNNNGGGKNAEVAGSNDNVAGKVGTWI